MNFPILKTHKICHSLLIVWIMTQILTANAAPVQTRRVVGVVSDASTGERLPYITVTTGKKGRYAVTDSLGVFQLMIPSGTRLRITAEGFDPILYKGPYSNDTVRINLTPKVTTLEEFVVKPKKQKYSKKNNPAVDLMERVRRDHGKIAPEAIDGYNYDNYNKIVVALTDVEGGRGMWTIPVKDKKKLNQLIDTARWTGDKVMDLSIKEKSAVHVYRDGKSKEIVLGTRSDGLDKSFSNDYVNVFLDDALRDVDLYDNDIKMLRNEFVSPLSRAGADFYKYAIEDTVRIGDEMCVELSFAPHKPDMTSFNGKLYIPVADSVKYVRRALLRMPKATNVNYIRSMVISQNFTKDSLGKVHKVLDDLILTLQIVPNTPVFSFTRQARRNNFSYAGRPEYSSYLDMVGNTFKVNDWDVEDETFWTRARQVPLSYAESRLIGSNSALRSDKGFYWFEKLLNIVIKGYIPTGDSKSSKFDIGPINSFVSYTDASGWRLQLGGMTTANLFKHWFFRGYGAYSFKDHKWKGAAQVEYSFEKRKYHALEFPMNNLRLGWVYDNNQIGQGQGMFSNASLVGSLHRSSTDFITYRHQVVGEYEKEWRNNWSIKAGFRYTRQEKSHNVDFVYGNGREIGHFGQSAFTFAIRWAPNEKFYQNLDTRTNVTRDALVLNLRHEYGPKGLFGSRYNVSKTEFGLDKEFWLSAYGHVDIAIRAGKIWTQVPFTELFWQEANTSYTMNRYSYSMLNPMEFAMDEYASWSLQYYMNGIIFNRIPLIKKAKLREVIGFKGFFGHLSDKNNPMKAWGVLRFPDPNTSLMGSTPYMECSVGIDNILTLFRVDYVWRLTYRNRPGIDHSGVRVGLHFAF